MLSAGGVGAQVDDQAPDSGGSIGFRVELIERVFSAWAIWQCVSAIGPSSRASDIMAVARASSGLPAPPPFVDAPPTGFSAWAIGSIPPTLISDVFDRSTMVNPSLGGY
jgi:hypothetical protein